MAAGAFSENLTSLVKSTKEILATLVVATKYEIPEGETPESAPVQEHSVSTPVQEALESAPERAVPEPAIEEVVPEPAPEEDVFEPTLERAVPVLVPVPEDFLKSISKSGPVIHKDIPEPVSEPVSKAYSFPASSVTPPVSVTITKPSWKPRPVRPVPVPKGASSQALIPPFPPSMSPVLLDI